MQSECELIRLLKDEKERLEMCIEYFKKIIEEDNKIKKVGIDKGSSLNEEFMNQDLESLKEVERMIKKATWRVIKND